MKLSSAKHAVVLGLFLALLVWRAVAGVWDVTKELRASLPNLEDALTAGEDERIGYGLAWWEREKKLPVGATYPLFLALRKHVPEDGVVFSIGAKLTPRSYFTVSTMNVVLYPRLFWPPVPLPPHWRDVAAGLKERCYFLVYDEPLPGDVAPAFVELARGDGFTLWQFKVER